MERLNLLALMPLVILTILMMGCVGASRYRQIPSIEDLSPRTAKAGGSGVYANRNWGTFYGQLRDSLEWCCASNDRDQ